jgi:hypothetical protein
MHDRSRTDGSHAWTQTYTHNNMTLVLDRYFVHRLRVVTGKDGNPLNEVELLSDSIMNNDGVLRGNNANPSGVRRQAECRRPNQAHGNAVRSPVQGLLRRTRTQVPVGRPTYDIA